MGSLQPEPYGWILECHFEDDTWYPFADGYEQSLENAEESLTELVKVHGAENCRIVALHRDLPRPEEVQYALQCGACKRIVIRDSDLDDGPCDHCGGHELYSTAVVHAGMGEAVREAKRELEEGCGDVAELSDAIVEFGPGTSDLRARAESALSGPFSRAADALTRALNE